MIAMSKLEIIYSDECNLEDFVKKDIRIGFIGGGNITQAIVKGFLKAGIINKNQIMVSAPTDRNRAKVEELGIEFVHDNQYVVDSCNVIILAMKPYQCREVVAALSNLTMDKMVLSAAAGVSMAAHLDFGLSQCAFGRIMPSTPVAVCAGIIGYCFAPHLRNVDVNKELLHIIFKDIAIVEEVSEEQIDLVAALGSAPAFMCEAIQGITYGIVKMGIPLHIAERLTPQIAVGTGKLILESGNHPAVVADGICSAGGSTIHGIHAAHKSGLRSAMMDAVEAAALRAKQMSEMNK